VTAAVAIFSVLLFLVAFQLVRIVPAARRAIAIAQGALGAMRDPALNDDAREKAVQRASIALFGAFGSILLRSLLALAAAVAPIWLADQVGWAQTESVVDLLSRWDIIVGASVLICGLFYAQGRLGLRP